MYESMFIYNHLYEWLLANPYQLDSLIELIKSLPKSSQLDLESVARPD